MEQNNLILVHFGSPAANQGKVGSRINLDLKITEKEQAVQIAESFRIEFKVKAKPGKGEEALKTFKKLFDPERRFKPIPPVVYYSIKEGHIVINYNLEGDTVTVQVLPGPQFKALTEGFAETLKKYGFSDVSKDGFHFQTTLTSPDSFIQKAMSFAGCEDDFIFPHLLANTRMETKFDRTHSHLSVLDSFLNLVLPNRRLMNFSCLEFLSIETEVDLDHTEFTPEVVSKNYLFTTIENLFRDCNSHCNSYTERQLKQIAKLKVFLVDQVVPDLEVRITVKELALLTVQLAGEGLFEFLEFICLHPPFGEHKDQKSKFYSLWMDKVTSHKN